MAYTGASLILEKVCRRSSFYDIACFSILANGPNLGATITSDNIFGSSSIDAIIFDCEPVIWMLLLLYINFFSRFRTLPIIERLNSRSLWLGLISDGPQ